MKACKRFIHLLTLLVLVSGVCSARDELIEVYEHIWTRACGSSVSSQPQALGYEQGLVTKVEVRKPPNGRGYGISINNPLPIPVGVRVTVDGEALRELQQPGYEYAHAVSQDTHEPVRLAVVRRLPHKVLVQYALMKSTAVEYFMKKENDPWCS
ncbi:hypothetical protein PTTG_27542 [Puccinia triticina 1-1 BBBD Race 1]|uniref:PDZ domain-containing protein n=2 Tax=Puccinia triticina TaxID=208348 RepID=A0A180GKD0_PUCT1|nr:uncharacterized protein PtA15_3A412 [Puccinia triticina]OAV92792.1 hypothetical protein PTTG_27542 [Puccinia triticina 1-1 BBBD Race 1]WAQ83046.1 hypothetical protein PtA15_3A412 [Puccinia triticina]WAR53879.1 hypothetical protein PtB15_3B388 [Puccinia triticina]